MRDRDQGGDLERRERVPGRARTKLKAAVVAAALGLGFSGFACSSTSGGASGDTSTARLYRRQCAACHGPEGAGGRIGSLDVADLRGPHAVAFTNEQLYQKIYNGEKGMPPFKYSLSEQQIHDLVRFIRRDIQKQDKK
jgi:mono/diheme cytochrome c family protein